MPAPLPLYVNAVVGNGPEYAIVPDSVIGLSVTFGCGTTLLPGTNVALAVKTFTLSVLALIDALVESVTFCVVPVPKPRVSTVFAASGAGRFATDNVEYVLLRVIVLVSTVDPPLVVIAI